MRLAFLTNLYPPYVVGGNEMLCDEVVTALRARGHDVHVVCGRGRELPLRRDVYGALDLDLDRKQDTFLGGHSPGFAEAFRWHLFNPRSYAAVTRLLVEIRPEVVVVWNLYLASLAPLVAARRSGLPVVTHVADKWLHHSLRDVLPILKADASCRRWLRLAQAVVGPLLRRAARPRPIVAISDFIKRFYVASGFADADVRVIHLGVPVREFAFRERAGKAPGEPVRLLFAGALWEGKGPQTAVRALGRLLRGGVSNVHLDVCGSGTPQFLSWLQAVIDEEGVSAHLTLHGFVERSVVRRFCESHDVLVFPSQWDEPFAAVPVEAMSCGMAIVATTAGGTPEAITDGETGLLVPPGDPDALAAALRRLVEDGALRRRLGAEAARVARERFDFDRYVERLESCYAGLRGA